MGAKGRKHADRAFIRGWAYNRMYFLFKGKFVYNGGPMGGGAYKRRFTALQECFPFSNLFHSIPKS